MPCPPPVGLILNEGGAPISDRDMEIGKAIMIEIDIYIKIEIKIERWR